MPKTLGIKGLFATVCLICLFMAHSARAEGYFCLVLIDGTVVEGEMIRITPATIEIDPEGPEDFASYNQGVIRDILYTRHKPGAPAKIEPVRDKGEKTVAKGILAVKFNVEKGAKPGDAIGLVRDYVMIDGRLYFTGRFEDFMIELPSGNHTLELCGIDMAYHEPSDFYSLENGGSCPRIWRQDNAFSFGKSMNIHVRRDSATFITLGKQYRDYLFVSMQKSRIINREDLPPNIQATFKRLSVENGIVPGKLVFEELPRNYIFHDSLEYRYAFVFNESEWGRFNDAAYLPGNYAIEARAIAWNTWKDNLISETISRCEAKIESGHTTIVKFELNVNDLFCSFTVLPDSRFEISTRDLKE
ncbi:MAG: hypothetical protein JSW64_09700 [Candidatus Zixiibacteriota bacterium]|nr:MAG: hypothetical protein JSW64_09700 [candidate division Zixibacteria bacterium]